MEKKDVCKIILMSTEEANILHDKAEKSGMSESEYIRYLIRGINPIIALTESFHTDMENLNRIGRNINQMTRLALSKGYVGNTEIEFLKEMKKSIDKCYNEIIEKIMTPTKFKSPCCESVNESIDITELMEEMEKDY